ncbi:MAG: hypothetical protein NSGCLCUN01_00769 [uncultured Clostridium sp.]
MFTSSKDLETLIYKCLLYVKNSTDNTLEHDLYFDDENHDYLDINYAFKEAVRLNYISGIHPFEGPDGNFEIHRTAPKLTLDGFKFIENFKP